MSQKVEGVLVERLRNIREYLGLSEYTVANYLKTSIDSLHDFENGKRKIDSIELEKLLELYKFPISYFTGQEDEEEEKGFIEFAARVKQDLTHVDKDQVILFSKFLKYLGLRKK